MDGHIIYALHIKYQRYFINYFKYPVVNFHHIQLGNPHFFGCLKWQKWKWGWYQFNETHKYTRCGHNNMELDVLKRWNLVHEHCYKAATLQLHLHSSICTLILLPRDMVICILCGCCWNREAFNIRYHMAGSGDVQHLTGFNDIFRQWLNSVTWHTVCLTSW